MPLSVDRATNSYAVKELQLLEEYKKNFDVSIRPSDARISFDINFVVYS